MRRKGLVPRERLASRDVGHAGGPEVWPGAMRSEHGVFEHGGVEAEAPDFLPPRPEGPVRVCEYVRSDERILDELVDRLSRSWIRARDVHVEVAHGEVTLTGSVPTRWERRAIEDLAHDVLGVRAVHGYLQVTGEPPPPRWSELERG